MSLDEKREQYEKQMRRMLNDPTGMEVVGKALGLELHAHKELNDKPVVAVLVPSYKSPAANMLDARTRLLIYSKQFCTVFSEPIRGSSVIHWVRNDMVAPLYKEKKKFTHVLWLDDDMMFEPDTLVKLLRHDKDVVGAAYVGRSDPPMPTIHLMQLDGGHAPRVLSWDQPGLRKEGDLVTSDREDYTLTCGTGVMLIKKEVLDRVGQMYVNCEYEQQMWGLGGDRLREITETRKKYAEESGNHWWFEFLPRLMGFAENGEDTSLCLKAAMCGYRVWVDTAMKIGHIGEYAFSYDDYLPYQGQEIMKAKKQGLWSPDEKPAGV